MLRMTVGAAMNELPLHALPARWHGPHRARHRLRGSTASAAAAVLVMAGLLIAFQQVVSEAVRQGEMRRLAVLAHATATWQCKALRSLRERDDCLRNLEPRSTRVAALLDTDHSAVSPAHGDDAR